MRALTNLTRECSSASRGSRAATSRASGAGIRQSASRAESACEIAARNLAARAARRGGAARSGGTRRHRRRRCAAAVAGGARRVALRAALRAIGVSAGVGGAEAARGVGGGEARRCGCPWSYRVARSADA